MLSRIIRGGVPVSGFYYSARYRISRKMPNLSGRILDIKNAVKRKRRKRLKKLAIFYDFFFKNKIVKNCRFFVCLLRFWRHFYNPVSGRIVDTKAEYRIFRISGTPLIIRRVVQLPPPPLNRIEGNFYYCHKLHCRPKESITSN